MCSDLTLRSPRIEIELLNGKRSMKYVILMLFDKPSKCMHVFYMIRSSRAETELLNGKVLEEVCPFNIVRHGFIMCALFIMIRSSRAETELHRLKSTRH